jgi:hypothetical protein
MTGGPSREGRYVEVSHTGFGASCNLIPFPFGTMVEVCGGVWFGSSSYNGFNFTSASTIVTSERRCH